MNTVKSLGLVGLAITAMFATQAFATPTCPVSPVSAAGQMKGAPVCIAPWGSDGQGTGLQDKLGPSSNPNSIFSSGPGVNPYTQQVQTPLWQVTGSSGSVSTILLQIAAYAGKDTFGIFDPTNITNKLAIFTNGQTGNSATLTVFTNGGYSINDGNNPQVIFGTTNEFGFYLTTPEGHTYYSMPSLNETGGTTYPNGTPHMVTYQGDGKSSLKPFGNKPGGLWVSNEYIQAWEDLSWGNSDLDYNDFVVMVESIRPVPEPAVLGMFGLGVLLIGGFATLRRRYTV